MVFTILSSNDTRAPAALVIFWREGLAADRPWVCHNDES